MFWNYKKYMTNVHLHSESSIGWLKIFDVSCTDVFVHKNELAVSDPTCEIPHFFETFVQPKIIVQP